MSIVNIVEDDLAVLSATADLLDVRGYTVRRFSHVESFLAQTLVEEESVTLISFAVSGGRGMSLLRDIQQRGMRTCVIMISDGEDTAHVVQAMKSGAVDVLEKPYMVGQLLESIASVFVATVTPVTGG